jgi:DNA modification methylase
MTQKIPPLASKQLEPLLTPITDIRPHPDNYKSHPPEQIRALRASLKAFGVTAPIKANLEGLIVAGHGMYQLYIEDGYTHIPVLYEALDKNLSKAYLVADNETARRAVTEQDKLNELLEGALGIPDFDIEAVGFSSEDIDNLLKSDEHVEVVEDKFNPDDVKEARCKEGDLWQLGRHLLLCGDCTDENNIKMLMNGVKADMVFTDPPYSVNYSEKAKNILNSSNYVEIKNDNLSVEETANSIWLPSFTNMFNYSTDECSIYCTMPQGGDQMMMMMMMMGKAGWQVKHELIWVKEAPVFSMGRLDYDYKHEPIVYGWKKKHMFYGKGDFTKSVWEIPRTENKLHPTMKPVALIGNALLNSTKEGDNVLDLFSGSGSTLMACDQLNRIFFGTELDPHYCDVILSRWEQFTNQTAKKLN